MTDATPEDGRRDLTLSRRIDAPVAAVWEAWTNPEHFIEWWTPAPVATTACTLDLRPGGTFATTMRLPDGQEHASEGVFLEVVPQRRIVFTDALLPGWRPAESPFMTAIIEMAEDGGGTRYTATVLHKDDADRQKHAAMGFEQGWGTALSQLEALAKSLAA